MKEKSQVNAKIENIRHSLAHLLAMAVLKKFPDAKLGIGPVIENGFYYDFALPRPITDADLPEIEKTMREIIAERMAFFGQKVTPAKAKKIFAKQPFKLDLIKDFVKEKKPPTIYYTCPPSSKFQIPSSDCFTDLCRGGHVENTLEINPDAFRLAKIAGAYWKGNEKNTQLTRIYAVAFETKEELDKHLAMLADAEKRDHRVLGERLGIFMFSQKVGQGFPLWLPNGEVIKHELQEYMRKKEEAAGYRYVATGALASGELYDASGHKSYFGEDMYRLTDIEEKELFVKPMNCPHHHVMYQRLVTSYRDLPLRLAEAGAIYRNERSGTLYGLIRVRGPITQNDAHVYITEEQLEQEFINVIKLMKEVYRDVGIANYWFRLSLPDFKGKNRKKFGGDPKLWKWASDLMLNAAKNAGIEIVPAHGEAAFYGPKLDVQIRNVFGKEDTLATSQIDILVPKRMGLTYVDASGEEQNPIVIHQAILGAYERFVAFLLEQTAGNLPFWLSPTQVGVLLITDEVREYGIKIANELRTRTFRISVDDRSETIGKKIREAEMRKIPYLLVIGKREAEAATVSVRKRGKGDIGSMPLKQLITHISDRANKI